MYTLSSCQETIEIVGIFPFISYTFYILVSYTLLYIGNKKARTRKCTGFHLLIVSNFSLILLRHATDMKAIVAPITAPVTVPMPTKSSCFFLSVMPFLSIFNQSEILVIPLRLQSYDNKTRKENKTHRFYPLFIKILIYWYSICTKDFHCAMPKCQIIIHIATHPISTGGTLFVLFLIILPYENHTIR